MSSSGTVIPGVPEGDFSPDEWTELREVLLAAEPAWRSVATGFNLRLLSSARWPELRLQRHVGWTTAELRVALQPDSVVVPPSESQWAISFVRYPRFAWLPFVGSSVETIKVLSASELRSGNLLPHIHDVIGRLTSGGH